MPFGLNNAISTFQRLMDEFSVGLGESIQMYMDDVIVFSRTETEHSRHLRELLKYLERFGLKVARETTSFFQPQVKLLGHVVSWAGVAPNLEKVKAIENMPLPRNVKEIGTFLGMVNYYGELLIA